MKRAEEATLLDVLVDGFERNETLGGYHWRELPLDSEAAARTKFTALLDEGVRWKGNPVRTEETPQRQLCTWGDLEIRRAGRAILLRVRAPGFDAWWHDSATWDGDPMDPIVQWMEEG